MQSGSWFRYPVPASWSIPCVGAEDNLGFAKCYVSGVMPQNFGERPPTDCPQLQISKRAAM
jgi:hypothetical protein